MKIRSFTLAAVIVALVAAMAPCAHAAKSRTVAGGGLTLAPHAVVVSSSLPHCRQEDGSGKRQAFPCSWNIGPDQDGNGIGAAYWIGRNHATHYVWSTDPTAGHPARAWVDSWWADWTDTSTRCWVREGARETVIGCPDGSRLHLPPTGA